MLVKEFVPYKQALALKELGFDEHCFKMSEHKKVCDEQSKPQGCQLHNLHCGYPDCTIDKSITPVPLPTFSQAFRWFRKKYDWQHSIEPTADQHSHQLGYNYWIWNYKTGEEYHTMPKNRPSGDWEYKSYEEAELACLIKLIQIVKEKK